MTDAERTMIPAPRGPTATRGFTLVEMVLVIVLTGVLAVTLFARFDTADFQRQGFYEQALAGARYAHKVAIASGCEVQYQLDGAGFGLRQRANCTTGAFDVAVRDPAEGMSVAFDKNAPAGTAIVGIATVFNSLGIPSVSGTATIQGRQFTIEAETGFVHP